MYLAGCREEPINWKRAGTQDGTGTLYIGWIYELPAKGRLKGKPYGYTGIDADEVTLTASPISDHLWVLDAKDTSQEKWCFDFSYALYKMEAGKWEEIEQE
jgi:hypothetical protein